MISKLQSDPEKHSATFSDYIRIIEQSPFAVIIANAQQEVVYANHSASQIINVHCDDEKPLLLHDVFKQNSKKWEDVNKALLENVECGFETKLKVPKGKLIDIDVICKKIQYDNQSATLLYIRDISNQKSLESQLIQEQSTRQMILDSIPAMIFVKDTQNRILSINKTYEEITGFSMDYIKGKSIFDLVDNQKISDKYWKDDLEVIETGLPKRNIIEPLISDFSKWFITDKIPYRNAKGKIIGVIGFSIDVTERKNAEDALVRSEKKFRLLFDSSPDGIVISNLKGRFLSSNLAFQQLLGYSDDELMELDFSKISINKDEETELNLVFRALNNGANSETFEKEYLTKQGKLIPVRVTCWIINDDLGKPIQLGVYVKDISFEIIAGKLEKSILQKEKEQLESELLAQTQQLNLKITQLIEKNQMVSNLVSQLERLTNMSPEMMKREARSIIRDLNNHTNEDFWTQFETTFGQINQSFYDNINSAFPSLTGNERKISAFLKMNLSTKDIANITHQSIRSIEMARSRLRKKLNLKRNENLTKYLNQF